MTRRRRRGLAALVAIVVLDQLLLWTFATRPIGHIRPLITGTGAADPPYFELRPGLDTTYSSWRRGSVSHIHTNALGFRDHERAVARTRGVRRVVLTGDSITFGIGVNDEEAFPQQLQCQLQEQGKSDVEVWNAGVPGSPRQGEAGTVPRGPAAQQ